MSRTAQENKGAGRFGHVQPWKRIESFSQDNQNQTSTQAHSPGCIIRISSRLEIEGLPTELVGLFKQENSFANPKFQTLERLQKWVGGTERFIHLWRDTEDGLCLPRGYFPTVIFKLREHNIPFQIVDETVSPKLDEPIEFRGKLFPYQERALADLLNRRAGLLEGPTGCGKTNVLCAAIPRIQTTSLILVHTKPLLQQTIQRVIDLLGIEPGIVGDGKFSIKPVTVGMVQTLARRDLKTDGMSKYFGAVLVDEVHHSPAATWSAILDQLPAKCRYGFSATTWRKDGFGFLMYRLVGPKTAKITRQEVEDAGRIVSPEIAQVPTNYFRWMSDPAEWPAMLSDLTNDPDRNSVIEEEVRARLSPTSQGLILTDRIEHARLLADLLQDFGPVLLTGELSKSERVSRMEAIRNGAHLTIATTHLLGEGVDVPGWDLLFLVTPMGKAPRVLQAVGRVARPAPGKTRAVVIDFVDTRVPMLAAAARGRMKLYAA